MIARNNEKKVDYIVCGNFQRTELALDKKPVTRSELFFQMNSLPVTGLLNKI